MSKMKKIGVCMAAVAGAAGIAGLSAKAVEGVRKKWFLRGFEAGQFIGSLTAAIHTPIFFILLILCPHFLRSHRPDHRRTSYRPQ